MSRLSWRFALLVGCLATAVALALQTMLRDIWQIRTLAERVMEWLLLFVPLDLFERALGQLGAGAKEVALLGTIGGLAVLLAVIGAAVLRADWPSRRLLALGLAMWLVTMALVMPVTGAGFFATGLLVSPLLTSAGYLLMFLGYADVLVGGRLIGQRRLWPGATTRPDRRALLAGVVGALAAGVAARLVGSDGGLVPSSLPLASAPAPAPAADRPTPASVDATSQPTPPGAYAAVPGLPTPSTATPPLPTAASLEAVPGPPPARTLRRDSDGSLTAASRPRGGLSPQITANTDFFIVTKNAVADPVLDARTWRLIVDGEVNAPVQLDYRTLRALPTVEITKTLECISNFTASCEMASFGCDLISTARWKGARLSDVLALAGGLKPSAVALAILSADEFSAGLPADVARDPETLVVYEMNGDLLPREHGFPARLLVPGRYGMKNPKWLAGIRATSAEFQGWYEQRNWNKDGFVKTMSRIDVPVDGTLFTSGEHRVAGIAYAGNRGVSKVEFSTDDGATWQLARLLEPMPGTDAIVRWEGTFSIAQGRKTTITMRATDGEGVPQAADFQLPQPDGATGRHSITVSAP